MPKKGKNHHRRLRAQRPEPRLNMRDSGLDISIRLEKKLLNRNDSPIKNAARIINLRWTMKS
jgi:hypothetical protein